VNLHMTSAERMKIHQGINADPSSREVNPFIRMLLTMLVEDASILDGEGARLREELESARKIVRLASSPDLNPVRSNAILIHEINKAVMAHNHRYGCWQ